MSDLGWIVVTKWEEFQHRDMARSNVPPWVKMYTRLLADDDFLGLSHHLRGVLMGVWLEYARATRQLRGSTSALTRRLGQRVTTRDLESLNHAGFITFSASKPASNHDSALAGVEVEVEVEGFNKTPSNPAATFAHRVATDPRGRDREHKPYDPPNDPAGSIRSLIRNGVITEPLALEAELSALGVNGDQAGELRAMLEQNEAAA